MTSYHLAQLNIAKMKHSLDDPVMADFINNLDNINQLADNAPGFVWRLITDAGVIDPSEQKLFSDDALVNMSVWTDVESLHNYVYRTAHAKIMSRRKDWFEHLREAYTVLWWIPAGTIPTILEAKQKLELLRLNGPTPDAFTFKQPYLTPDPDNDNEFVEFDDLCPAP